MFEELEKIELGEDLSVKWRVFDQTVNQAREAFAFLPGGELRDTIEEAILNVRKQNHRQLRSRPRK